MSFAKKYFIPIIVLTAAFVLANAILATAQDLQIEPTKEPPPRCLGPWYRVASGISSGGQSAESCGYTVPGSSETSRWGVWTYSPHCTYWRDQRDPAACQPLRDALVLQASSERFPEGGGFTVNWELRDFDMFSYEEKCTISGKAPEVGQFSEQSLRGSKSYDFVQKGIYSFKFTCTGILNNKVSTDIGDASVSILVFAGDIPPPPEVVEFKVEPAVIRKGEKATLSWSVTNGASISVNQGVGVVRPQGSVEVSPNFTTQYRITAAGEFPELGLARKSVTLRVVAPDVERPPEVPIDVPPDVIPEAPKPTEEARVDLKVNGSDGPLTVRAPANLNLSWNLDNYCLAYGSWLGVKRAAGQESKRETEAGTYTYKLYCPTVGSDEVTVNVVGGSGDGQAAVALPVAEASISVDGRNFSKSIRVIRGEPTPIWLGAAYDVTGDNRASRDETGRWTSLMSFGGRCEWNSDLNQGEPVFDIGAFDPQSAEECTAPLGTLTFYDEAGTYRYGALRLVQSDGKFSNTSYVNIIVNDPPPPDSPPVIDLRINNLEGPVTLGAPAEYTLSWNVRNARSCSASDDWEGKKFLAGSQQFFASEKRDLTYTLTCEGDLGTTSESIFLRVAELPICDFSATPMTIDSSSAFNRQSILDWKCQFANTCSIGPEVGSVDTFGFTRVSPRETTTYTLTCNNLEGTSSFDQVIEVR